MHKLCPLIPKSNGSMGKNEHNTAMFEIKGKELSHHYHYSVRFCFNWTFNTFLFFLAGVADQN